MTSSPESLRGIPKASGVLSAVVHRSGSRVTYLSHEGAHPLLNLDANICAGGDWYEACVIHEDEPPMPPQENGLWVLTMPWTSAQHHKDNLECQERNRGADAEHFECECDSEELCCLFGPPSWERYERRILAVVGQQEMFPIQKGNAIPWALIAPYDYQCKANHGGQDLKRIAQRGGLSAKEALHVVRGLRWYDKGESTRIVELSDFAANEELHAWVVSRTPPRALVCPSCAATLADGESSHSCKRALGGEKPRISERDVLDSNTGTWVHRCSGDIEPEYVPGILVRKSAVLVEPAETKEEKGT